MRKVKFLVTSQKGGVGKSTLSANLAAYLSAVRGKSVTLLDFDHQGSSSHWAQEVPVENLRVDHCDAITGSDSNLAVLKMNQALRNAERASDIVIADLTWVNVLPVSFLFQFDCVLVPTSLSQVELNSSMAFIAGVANVFNAAPNASPRLVLVPSRLHRMMDYENMFNETNFPVRFSVSSPLPFLVDIQNLYGKEYLFRHDNAFSRNCFMQVGQEINDIAESLASTSFLDGPFASPRDHAGNSNFGSTVLQKFMMERKATPSQQSRAGTTYPIRPQPLKVSALSEVQMSAKSQSEERPHRSWLSLFRRSA